VVKLYCDFKLAEGPVYIKDIDTLVWVDIDGCELHYFNFITNKKDSFHFEKKIGAVVPFKKNLVICAVGDSLIYFDLIHKKILKSVKIFKNDLLRFNDGKCDKYGNLWIGTMALDFNGDSSKNIGSLYCIKKDKVVAEYKNFSIPNGMCWIDDNFFHIDTDKKTLYKYDVENQYKLTNKESYITNFDASPDGMTLDDRNNFWIALWGGNKIVCYDSKSKKEIDEIYFDNKFITCPTFGLENHDYLFVTSAMDEKHSGAIYMLKTKYRGVPPYKYNGQI
jgi:sugar lactone lactonase YvrE